MTTISNIATNNEEIITLTCETTIYPLNDRSVLSILANGWDTIEYEYEHGILKYLTLEEALIFRTLSRECLDAVNIAPFSNDGNDLKWNKEIPGTECVERWGDCFPIGKLSLLSINPLHPYIIRGKEGVVELIRDAHPIWLNSWFWGKTLLHHSVEARNIECVRALVERGVNVNELDGSNKTPLHITAIHDYPEIAKLLIDSGASVNTSILYKIIEFKKLTPLYFAKIYGSDRVEKLLIAKGAI